MDPSELTVNFADNGQQRVRELDKRVLAHSSSWATLLFLFCEIDPQSGEERPPKVGLRRYKKRAGRWVLDKHFVIASAKQARGLGEALLSWFPAAPDTGAADDDADEGD